MAAAGGRCPELEGEPHRTVRPHPLHRLGVFGDALAVQAQVRDSVAQGRPHRRSVQAPRGRTRFRSVWRVAGQAAEEPFAHSGSVQGMDGVAVGFSARQVSNRMEAYASSWSAGKTARRAVS